MEFLKVLYKSIFGGEHASMFLAKQQGEMNDLRDRHHAAKAKLIKNNEAINRAKLAVVEELSLQFAETEVEIKLLKGE